MANGIKIDREHLKPLPVGNSIWEDFSQKCYTVDKTLLIKELLDDRTTVALFTRPRRFGKTTALRNRYRVRSNRGSGDGRFDIELKPLIPDFPGVVETCRLRRAL